MRDLLLDRGADINQVLYYRVPAYLSDTHANIVREPHTHVTIMQSLDIVHPWIILCIGAYC